MARIVWFSWKDIDHPLAGGAEVISDQLRLRLVKDGHTVTLITSSYDGAKQEEIVKGVRVIRSGNRYSVYLNAYKIFRTLSIEGAILVDEMNTIPFFTAFYGKKNETILLSYQLARIVWFYQMVFPLSLIGFLVEPLYLRLMSKRYSLILTESMSTKKELLKFGFIDSRVKVFPVGTDIKPLGNIKEKNSSNIILFLGALRPMKRPIDAIKAFESARDDDPTISLIIAGDKSSKYGKKVERYSQESRHKKSIKLLGRITSNEKIELLKKAKIILITSVKEGWGLIATEANTQGTPAIAYDADGLRDSVTDKKTGILVGSGDIDALGNELKSLLLDNNRYKELSAEALSNSREFTYEKSYKKFVTLLGLNK